MNEFIARANNYIKKSKTISDDILSDFADYYLTGLLPFDFRNSCKNYINLVDGSKRLCYEGLGVKEGSLNMITGGTGVGKTTFTEQCVESIVKRFPESACFYFDTEGGADKNKIEIITALAAKNEKIKIYSKGITGDVFFKIAQDHCNYKLQKWADKDEKFIYDSKIVNEFGKPIKKLIPTVIVLDSLAGMVNESVMNDTESAGKTMGMAQAAENTRIFKVFNQKAVQANVIFFIINWVNDKADMGFVPKPDVLTTLAGKQIHIPGGNAVQYFASNILYLNHKKTLSAEKDAYHVDARIVEFNLLKTRTNTPKASVNLMFNSEGVGYYDLYGSILYNFIENGVVAKVTGGYKLKNYPFVKFGKDLVSFKELIETNIGFRIALMKETKNYFSQYMSDSKKYQAKNVNMLNDNLLKRFNIQI